MKIAIASDHEGFELKDELIKFLTEKNIHLVDLGTYSLDAVDYPVFAENVGIEIRDKEADRGILICGSGIGINIAANRMPWIRAGICHDTYSAHQGVEHDAMNVLVMGAGIIGLKLAFEIVQAFLKAEFSGDERHKRRIEEVAAIARRYSSERK